MGAKLLTEKAISVINKYENFNVGFAVTNVPYYNNRREKARARLRAQIGKGNPAEIQEEAESAAAVQKINLKALDSISLKKFLVSNNLGIDCSGLAYHVLDAELQGRGKGKLKLSYSEAPGIYKKIISAIRPAENAGVTIFASEKNSRIVPLRFVEPGDMITILKGPDSKNRDHILVIHEVDYRDDVVVAINYTHSIAWPTDGEFDHGVRQGIIKVTDPDKGILDQDWEEAGMTGENNYTFANALKSKTELRRLHGL